MKKSYVNSKKFWEEISKEERTDAVKNNQLFICHVRECNYKTLDHGIFDPQKGDIISLIAIFNDILDAKIFVNARQCMEDISEDL